MDSSLSGGEFLVSNKTTVLHHKGKNRIADPAPNDQGQPPPACHPVDEALIAFTIAAPGPMAIMSDFPKR